MSFLLVTRQCNFLCQHCMYACGPTPAHMSDKTFSRALDLLKGRDVVMMGGEPTLHPKFPQYLDKLSHTATSLALITNGSLLRTRRDVIPAIRRAADTLGLERFAVKVSASIWHLNFISWQSLIRNAEALDKAVGDKAFVFIDEGSNEMRLGRARINWDIMRHMRDLNGEKPPCENVNVKKDGPALIDVNGDAYACISQKESLLGNINDHSIDELGAGAKTIGTRYRHGSGCGECIHNTTTDPAPVIAPHYKSPRYVSPNRLATLFTFARKVAKRTQAEVAATMGVYSGDVSRFESYTAPIRHENLARACEALHINHAFLEDPGANPFIYPDNTLSLAADPNEIYSRIMELFIITRQKNIILVSELKANEMQTIQTPSSEKYCHTVAVQDTHDNLIVFFSRQRRAKTINNIQVDWVQSKMEEACGVSRDPAARKVFVYADHDLQKTLPTNSSVRQYFDKILRLHQ